MNAGDRVIRDIADTARLAAAYRALESERPDAVFRDPFARRLAGPRGEAMLEAVPGGRRDAWAWVTRTYLFDQVIGEQVRHGLDMVVNLAAGLDARPYRMPLPASLRWVEVDFPDLIDYKEQALEGERAACSLERIRLDLSDVGARRALFERLGRASKKALVITEGLLIYLTPPEVGSLAEDLAAAPGFQRWVCEIVSPGLLRRLQREIGVRLSEADAPLKFGPEQGPAFFAEHGWEPVDVRSMLRTAARLKRVPLWMRLMSRLPESTGRQGSSPWAGVCLLGRGGSAASPLRRAA
jgi:methyltransferase (TIGR00027 family)